MLVGSSNGLDWRSVIARIGIASNGQLVKFITFDRYY